MSINLNAQPVITSLVEAMLPKFSDRKLGLLIEIRMNFADFGYGEDGNTIERDELNIYRHINFLFVRSTNYTKVFCLEIDKNAKGLDVSPYYSKEIQEWQLESDHDSCWSSDGIQKLTTMYYDAIEKFDGRLVSGKPICSNKLYEHIAFNRNPYYVEFDVCEQKNEKADRWSKEGRVWNIKFNPITMAKLEMVEKDNSSSGLLIKGGVDHALYLRRWKETKETKE